MKNAHFLDPPFAPKEFSVQFRTASSLLLTWLKIPENETGTDFTEYRLEYYISTIGALNKTMIKIPQSSNSYLLDGLLYNTEYTLFLSGFNIYGQGPSVSLTAIPYGCKKKFILLKAIIFYLVIFFLSIKYFKIGSSF